jgi:hypothetical protein
MMDEMKTTRRFIKYCILRGEPLWWALQNQEIVKGTVSYHLFELQEEMNNLQTELMKTWVGSLFSKIEKLLKVLIK